MRRLILLLQNLAVFENDGWAGYRELDVGKVVRFVILADFQRTVFLQDEGGEVLFRTRFDKSVANGEPAQIRVAGLRDRPTAERFVERAVDRERKTGALEESRRRFADGLAFVGRKIRMRRTRFDRDARRG